MIKICWGKWTRLNTKLAPNTAFRPWRSVWVMTRTLTSGTRLNLWILDLFSPNWVIVKRQTETVLFEKCTTFNGDKFTTVKFILVGRMAVECFWLNAGKCRNQTFINRWIHVLKRAYQKINGQHRKKTSENIGRVLAHLPWREHSASKHIFWQGDLKWNTTTPLSLWWEWHFTNIFSDMYSVISMQLPAHVKKCPVTCALDTKNCLVSLR